MTTESPDAYQWLRDLEQDYRRRLARYERQVQRCYGDTIWSHLEHARAAQRDPREWCWLPVATAHATAQEQTSADVPALHGAVLAAIGSWRAHGRCTVLPHENWRPELDPDATSVDQLAADLESTLPERCVYLALPAAAGVLGATGVFVHLEWDADIERTEIRVLLDVATDRTDINELLPQPVHVETGHSLTEALVRTWQRARNRADLLETAPPAWTREHTDQARQQARHLAAQLAVARGIGDPDLVYLAPLDQVLDAAVTDGMAEVYRPHSGGPDATFGLTLASPR